VTIPSTKAHVYSALLFSTLVYGARPARACTIAECTVPYFLPSNGATIPRNAPAILVRPRYGIATGVPAVMNGDYRLVHIDNGAEVDVPVTITAPSGQSDVFIVRPETTLPANAQFRIESKQHCSGSPTDKDALDFETGDEIPLPLQAGMLVAEDPLRGQVSVPSSTGDCIPVSIDAVKATVELTTHASVEPWLDLVIVDVRVDGAPLQPANSSGEPTGRPSRDRIRQTFYSACEELPPGATNEGLEPGAHTVELALKLPGHAAVFLSNPVTFNLDCQRAASNPNGEENVADGDSCACRAVGAGPAPRAHTLVGLMLVGAWLLRSRRRAL
jgi:hypothetical protein